MRRMNGDGERWAPRHISLLEESFIREIEETLHKVENVSTMMRSLIRAPHGIETARALAVFATWVAEELILRAGELSELLERREGLDCRGVKLGIISLEYQLGVMREVYDKTLEGTRP